MKFTLLPSLLSLLTFISGFAQTSLEIDTFRISTNKYIVEAPEDWFSIKVANEIQPDTSWNYIAKYISTGTNTVAQIAIQIVNNSNYTPTKKEERKFDKECTVTPTDISGFTGYSLKYDPQKPKDCKGCELVYQNMYSIPLNPCQTLRAAFIGQGPQKNIYPLQIAFSQFVQGFLTLNSKSLTAFQIVDFTQPMRRDTFRVHKYYLVSLIPYRFSNTGMRTVEGYSIQRTDCGSPFEIEVSSEVIFDGQPEVAKVNRTADTTIGYARPIDYITYQKSEHVLYTQRMISTPDGNKILVRIRFKFQDDQLYQQFHLAEMLREYSNALVTANPVAKISAPAIFKPPTIDPKPKNDIRQPVKFEKTMPAAKPK